MGYVVNGSFANVYNQSEISKLNLTDSRLILLDRFTYVDAENGTHAERKYLPRPENKTNLGYNNSPHCKMENWCQGPLSNFLGGDF